MLQGFMSCMHFPFYYFTLVLCAIKTKDMHKACILLKQKRSLFGKEYIDNEVIKCQVFKFQTDNSFQKLSRKRCGFF